MAISELKLFEALHHIVARGDVAFLQKSLNLKWAVPGPLGIRLASLCNLGAQIWCSVPCSLQEPMSTLKVTLVAAWAQAKAGDKRRMGSAHAFMLGEHKANVNSRDHFSVWPVSSQSTDFPNSLLMASRAADLGPSSPTPCRSTRA